MALLPGVGGKLIAYVGLEVNGKGETADNVSIKLPEQGKWPSLKMVSAPIPSLNNENKPSNLNELEENFKIKLRLKLGR